MVDLDVVFLWSHHMFVVRFCTRLVPVIGTLEALRRYWQNCFSCDSSGVVHWAEAETDLCSKSCFAVSYLFLYLQLTVIQTRFLLISSASNRHSNECVIHFTEHTKNTRTITHTRGWLELWGSLNKVVAIWRRQADCTAGEQPHQQHHFLSLRIL